MVGSQKSMKMFGKYKCLPANFCIRDRRVCVSMGSYRFPYQCELPKLYIYLFEIELRMVKLKNRPTIKS